MKYVATKDWAWHKDEVSVTVKSGDKVPDTLPPELIQTLLGMDNIMPAETKSAKPKAE
jgi:hypothetical protein